MQRRLIRLWLGSNLGHLRGLGLHHVEEIIRFVAQGPPQGRIAIPGGWNLVKHYDSIRLGKKRLKQEPVCYSYILPSQGELLVPEAGVKIQSSRGSLSSDPRSQGELEALFDLAFLPKALTVRNFRAGDRFRPLGMRGHRKKVKDLFIEKRVPLPVRSTLPLFLAGEEILWIPGYGRSEIAKFGPETKEVLKVRLSVHDG